MKSPNKFKNVHDLPESSIVEIPEIVISSEFGSEAAVLPDYKGKQSDGEKDKNWNVCECVRFFRKESLGICEEDSLEFSFVSIEAEHDD